MGFCEIGTVKPFPRHLNVNKFKIVHPIKVPLLTDALVTSRESPTTVSRGSAKRISKSEKMATSLHSSPIPGLWT